MKAKDVMTEEVVSATAETPVKELAQLMVKYRISAVPITNDSGSVIGIVSEGDLIRRAEIGTDRAGKAGSWLKLFADPDAMVKAYMRTHGHHADDVMSRRVITVTEDTPLSDIVWLLEKHRIKRVPVLQDGKLAGIVSRANLVQALAAVERHVPEPPGEDRALRARVKDAVRRTGVQIGFLNIVVHAGQVEIWGTIDSEIQLEAVRLAVGEVVPEERVQYHIAVLPDDVRGIMRAE